MKKAILIQPPIEDFYLTFVRTYPLNLCYLGDVLEKNGFDVEIVDMLDGCREILPFPKDFYELKSHYLPWDKSPYSLFKHYQRFGYSKELAENAIKNMDGDYFLIPSNFTAYFDRTLEIASLVRKYHKNSKIITGGYHASAVPSVVLNTGFFDHVIVGEGEAGLTQVIDGKQDPIIYSVEDKGFSERLPARHLLNHGNYIVNKRKSTSLTVSRGCPMKCEFCTIHSVYKYKYRKRNIESIINEIKHCHEVYNIEHFDFEDDNLSGHFFNSILDSILSLGLENCSFSAMNGIPYLGLDEQILTKMKKIGFTHLDISLATNQGIMNRQTDLEKFESVVKIAEKLKLPVNAYFILGLPEMNYEDNLKIINYLGTLNVNIGPSVYYTVPGIPYYSSEIPNILCRSTAAHTFKESKLSKEEVISLFRLCRAINFMKKESKTDFEKMVESETQKKGIVHVKKVKSTYEFTTVNGCETFKF